MYKVYFQDFAGKRKLIGTAETFTLARRGVMEFLQQKNYQSYYQRYWYIERDMEVEVDFGSHTEFFFIIGPNLKEELERMENNG